MSSARDKANRRIASLQSMLCVGLDSDPSKIPTLFHSMERPVLEFNRAIIRATGEHAAAYKVNTAFYESRGLAGMRDLDDTLQALPPECLSIADAKRADIGNTSRHYAKAFFETWPFDAITVAPYMGFDSLEPFFEYDDKLVFVLCLTSNPGSADFEERILDDGRPLYRAVLDRVRSWQRNGNAGIVVGATKASLLQELRQEAPELFFLIPGVGAQGGSMQEAVNQGADPDRGGAVVNVSRALIFPKGDFRSISEFEEAVRREAAKLHDDIKEVL
ncbi:MAG TPA: orotidine-5'-phosphate decarboxylase [Chlorobaculum sp.]|uniref:Orotidine-5'-phosphate decarboxylase n=1 Tax=Chlorobaculum tepidum (strain ATCC 49652 / DSM 12025 / NBRC 103806 / TLS) TaxID=194439 RepID=Q8KG39_CHLTE|nr:orotidine-5'-phosphate decarboxylase [Chlorobaculum tepidum]AAM71377.1 orotidine 5'-phosphate decarboxylase [Chlorobaculum tepidum TLS]HBU24388.1 orotidine-5'-phosphate decarboxylase [Chlorobaculum sp.]